ncbi:MAG: DUF2961 domain-containing protein [Phycisphaerae bacterium]|nr:DUF2961 domain-containing protein [Phycisphaerae bacterium]
MKKSFLMLIVCCCFVTKLQAQQINLSSLLDEMIDRTSIAKFPSPEFICMQASSYDRKAKEVGNADWFANDDWSNFIRVEAVDGRREWVMMDEQGPGVIVRWWITGFKFGGVIRVYLDGVSGAVFEGKADKLIGGDILLGEPLSAERSRGRNLYLPIAYAKSIKITYDGPHARETKDFNDNLYYNINYRKYPKGTDVKTFSMAEFKANAAKVANVQNKLLTGDENGLTITRTIKGSDVELKPGQNISRKFKGPGAICALKVRVKGDDLRQTMRSTVIIADFDGKQHVWAPVGEFFGTGLGANAYKGWWRQVDKDGWMSCWWPMPFKYSATVKIINYGKANVEVELGDIGISDWQWTDRTMYFNSSWRGENEIDVVGADRSTMQDWNYLTVQGKGVYVGDTLAIFNRANAWWGEGDEKVFVDGEKFPSHFGTGSEDYFGYAWCWPEYFTAPFHAQPCGDGNQKAGHSTNTRVRSLDGIPFNSSLQFDMELWHWATNSIDYATTTYWYAFDDAVGNGEVSLEKIGEKVGKQKIVIEGQDAQLRICSGGLTEIQKGNWGATGGSHLWWTHTSLGDVLEIEFNLNDDGLYNAGLQMLSAPDYGTFEVSLNGKVIIPAMDLFVADGVHIKQVELGKIKLAKGPHRLTFKVIDKKSKVRKGDLLGLDIIKLEKVD